MIHSTAPPRAETEWEQEQELVQFSKLLHRMSAAGPSVVRLKYLIAVSQKPRSRKELASILGVSLATVSGHTERLTHVNLIRETRTREIELIPQTIESLINFLQESLNLNEKETTTNV